MEIIRSIKPLQPYSKEEIAKKFNIIDAKIILLKKRKGSDQIQSSCLTLRAQNL